MYLDVLQRLCVLIFICRAQQDTVAASLSYTEQAAAECDSEMAFVEETLLTMVPEYKRKLVTISTKMDGLTQRVQKLSAGAAAWEENRQVAPQRQGAQ